MLVCNNHAEKNYAECVVCSGIRLQEKLSEISYLTGEPNEMQVSDYDVDYDAEKVVQKVHGLRARTIEECAKIAESYLGVSIVAARIRALLDQEPKPIAPPSPDRLVGALQDTVHRDLGRTKAARTAKVKSIRALADKPREGE
jgi:hypothetical protein